jgi:hypothetical protein
MFMVSGAALAQTPGAVGTPQQRQERPDQQTAPAREGQDYSALGVPVGSFRLFPDLELNETYNDNIYATPFGVAGQTGSFIQSFKPVLDLRSDWSSHMLNLFARGDIGLFSATSTMNHYDFATGFDGRIDIQREWNIYGGFSFNRRHEDPGTPSAPTPTSAVTAFSPTVYNQLVGNVGYYQRFNRLDVRLDGRWDNYTYFDNGLGLTQGVLPAYDRSRNELREALRFGYEFSPGYQVWARGGLNQRMYNSVPDAQGFDRNSNGWDLVAGVTVDLGGITSVEAFAGYLQQNYVSNQFSQVSAPTFGLTAYWNPLRELMIKPFVRRSVEDSGLSNASAYLSTAFGMDVDYQLRPNIQFNAHGDYSIADYINAAGQNTQNDQYLTLRAGVLYRPTRNFYIGPNYQFINRNSNVPFNNYDQNVVMLRLGARL